MCVSRVTSLALLLRCPPPAQAVCVTRRARCLRGRRGATLNCEAPFSRLRRRRAALVGALPTRTRSLCVCRGADLPRPEVRRFPAREASEWGVGRRVEGVALVCLILILFARLVAVERSFWAHRGAAHRGGAYGGKKRPWKAPEPSSGLRKRKLTTRSGAAGRSEEAQSGLNGVNNSHGIVDDWSILVDSRLSVLE